MVTAISVINWHHQCPYQWLSLIVMLLSGSTVYSHSYTPRLLLLGRCCCQRPRHQAVLYFSVAIVLHPKAGILYCRPGIILHQPGTGVFSPRTSVHLCCPGDGILRRP